VNLKQHASQRRAQLRALVERHEPRVWLLWAAGFGVMLCAALALADPGLLVLALDPEVVAVLVLGSVAQLRATAVGAVIRACSGRLARLRSLLRQRA
jgi:hypothetical protein